MPITPMQHQIVGAQFLAARSRALLADAPRVGKTGAAILASDLVDAATILVITTASGRPVWVKGFRDWSARDMQTEAVYGLPATDDFMKANRLIVSWHSLDKLLVRLLQRKWALIILDESHYAKSVEAKRTAAVYGTFRSASRGWGLVDTAERVWCLTGTPIPNAPNDLYPMLRTLAPERLEGVEKYEDFLHRYCVVRKKRLNWGGSIDIVVGGRNIEELRDRMKGFWLRRTQEDIGISTPIYDILPVHVTDTERSKIKRSSPEAAEVLLAAETGETRAMDVHLGKLRRLTGTLKATGVVRAVKDEFEGGLDKIVLMCWHKDVMDALTGLLAQFGVVRLDGSTSANRRAINIQKFQEDPETRVFIGQIIAAGEAIDLSAAAELIFVESSFVPKDMAQAALRITNIGQKRQPRVRVAALEGSIDEALQAILLRKVQTIKETLA